MYGEIVVQFDFGDGRFSDEELENKFSDFRDKLDDLILQEGLREYFEVSVIER